MRRVLPLKAYKYYIYPSDAQRVFSAKIFGCCRFVWNRILDKKLQSYKKKERIPGVTPVEYKKEFPFLKEVDCFALVAVQNHMVREDFHSGRPLLPIVKTLAPLRAQKRRLGTA